MIFPDDFEGRIDFSVIRKELSLRCSFSLGREQVDMMHFLGDEREIVHLLACAKEMVEVVSDASLTYPQGSMHDVREALARIRIDGLYLDEDELFCLRKTLDTALQMAQFLSRLDSGRFPNLHNKARDYGEDLKDVVAAVDRVIDKYGKMRDNASPELAKIRHEKVLAEGSVSRTLNAILRKAQADGYIDKDVAPTLREGRLVLPVPPAYKRKLSGIVHDESSTGKTVYVEPQQVVEANNKIRELEGDERRERLKILLALTEEIRPNVPSIMDSQVFLAEIDFLHAKGMFAKEINAIVPQMEKEPMLKLRTAYHPVLLLSFAKQGREVIPLDIELNKKNRILVISGPNAGGKSVCLKTVAMLQYMLQCGLPVPVREDSVMGVFEHIMIDIGDQQSIADDLSTYSSHLKNMKHFVRNSNGKTLVLIDEFGGGTEPLMGGAIAEAVLKKLNFLGVFGVVTTHYTNLKHLAERTDGIVNGAMLYDRGQLRPLFQLSMGQPGSSFALEIAQQIGLGEEVIADAKELIGSDNIDYDKHLQDIARDKRYWENKRQNIRQKEKHLEEKIAYYEQEISTLKEKKKQMMAEAKQQAADLLAETNATIENTIREIKQSKADKQRTKQAREKVEQLKEKVQTPTAKIVPIPLTTKDELPKRNGKTVFSDLSQLRAISRNPNAPVSQPIRSASTVSDTMHRRKLSFSLELDLRGLRADEALQKLEIYMDDAIMVGAKEVRILHGTGTGALRQVVRTYMSMQSAVKSYHDAHPDEGGAGITIVEM